MALSGSLSPSLCASQTRFTLESSERLSSGISLHTFSASRESLELFRPSGHINLSFCEDLDPTRPSTPETDRLLTFTPACVREVLEDGRCKVLILARNGKLTQLLGLPRLQGPLQADMVSAGDGFPEDALDQLGNTLCIASGTGLAAFLAIASRGFDTTNLRLFWTINGNDFCALEYLIKSGMIIPDNWACVDVFITSGDESQGIIPTKSVQWWQDRSIALVRVCGAHLGIHCGRMTQQHIQRAEPGNEHQVLYCGNKSLEWHVKMWFMNKAKVFTTSIV